MVRISTGWIGIFGKINLMNSIEVVHVSTHNSATLRLASDASQAQRTCF